MEVRIVAEQVAQQPQVARDRRKLRDVVAEGVVVFAPPGGQRLVLYGGEHSAVVIPVQRTAQSCHAQAERSSERDREHQAAALGLPQVRKPRNGQQHHERNQRHQVARPKTVAAVPHRILGRDRGHGRHGAKHHPRQAALRPQGVTDSEQAQHKRRRVEEQTSTR